jgi:hypothetical protein
MKQAVLVLGARFIASVILLNVVELLGKMRSKLLFSVGMKIVLILIMELLSYCEVF